MRKERKLRVSSQKLQQVVGALLFSLVVGVQGIRMLRLQTLQEVHSCSKLALLSNQLPHLQEVEVVLLPSLVMNPILR